ncbi:hypothetical protein [Fusibacter bizertensis]
MKKKILIPMILLAILLVPTYYLQKNSIEDVLEISPNTDNEIIHSETVNNKIIVLSKVEEKDLQFTIVKKGIFKYKAVYSSYMSDFDRTLDENGLIFIELPRSVMKDQLFCFGLMRDNSIIELEITDNTTFVKTSITNFDGFNYWSADLSKIKNRQILIKAYDIKEKEIIRVEEILDEN